MEKEILDNECPNCNRSYDEIDHEYQICSKCGFNSEEKMFKPGSKRKPTDQDYMSGEADILTGEWI